MLLNRRRAITTNQHRVYPPETVYDTLDSNSAYRMALTNNNLTYVPNFAPPGLQSYYSVARTTSSKSSGKYYIEMNRLTYSWSSATHYIGLSKTSVNELYISTNWYTVGSDFFRTNQFSAGSTVPIAVDFDNGKIFIGSSYNNILTWPNSQNPVTGANPKLTFTTGFDLKLTVAPFYYAYSYGDSWDSGTLRLSPEDIVYTAPEGYTVGWPI